MDKRCLLIVHSYHHHNTMKVAKAMAETASAKIVGLDEAKTLNLSHYDLIGFGAGIDSGHHYTPLLDYAKALDKIDHLNTFIFSTSAVQGKNKVHKDHTALREILLAKGYKVLDEFSCKGYNTNSFLKYLGGINKGYPRPEDLKRAENFIKRLSFNNS